MRIKVTHAAQAKRMLTSVQGTQANLALARVLIVLEDRTCRASVFTRMSRTGAYRERDPTHLLLRTLRTIQMLELLMPPQAAGTCRLPSMLCMTLLPSPGSSSTARP